MKAPYRRNVDDAARRAKEIERREEKRKMLAAFVEENSIGSAELTFAVDKALEIPLEERQEGIDFKTFCNLNQVDPTGEYLAMFELFDVEDSGLIDFKTITLGMLNFIEMPKEERCDFVFRIFDEDASGLLTMTELMAVLAANHMQSVEAVKRKADTIMKTVDKDGNGELSMDEFRNVGKKCKFFFIYVLLLLLLLLLLFSYIFPFFCVLRFMHTACNKRNIYVYIYFFFCLLFHYINNCYFAQICVFSKINPVPNILFPNFSKESEETAPTTPQEA
jgi:Ca2+-binding EF-hand superfamily protein